MSYATFMQNLIDNSNMSLDELANKLDMTTAAIRKIVADNVKNPSMQTIHKLAEILDVQPIDIAEQILCTIPTEKDGLTLDEINKISVYQRYLCYLYLNGYNVIFSPSYTTLDGSQMIFSGIATKKREPNNKILVDSFHSRCSIKDGENVNQRTVADFIAPFFMFDKINEFKRVDIVVDEIDQAIEMFIGLFAGHKLPLKFNLNIVEFDVKNGTVTRKVSLT